TLSPHVRTILRSSRINLERGWGQPRGPWSLATSPGASPLVSAITPYFFHAQPSWPNRRGPTVVAQPSWRKRGERLESPPVARAPPWLDDALTWALRRAYSVPI